MLARRKSLLSHKAPHNMPSSALRIAPVVQGDTAGFACEPVCGACVRREGLCERHAREIGKLVQFQWWLYQGQALVEQTRLQETTAAKAAKRRRRPVPVSPEQHAHQLRKSAARRVAAQRKRRFAERGTMALGLAAAILTPKAE